MPFVVCGNSPNCVTLVQRGFCDACVAAGARKIKRATASQRGYGSRWQKASKAYLAAHRVAVDWFGEHGGRQLPAEVVDHIVPHRGDMVLFWDASNWQGLTKADHDRKTAMEDGGFGNAVQPSR